MSRKPTMASSSVSVRLIPRWYVALAILLIGLAVVISLGLSFTVDGLMGWSFRVACAAFALLFVSACSALVRPRRRREPIVAPDGRRVFRSPAATVWPLVGWWLGMLVVAGLWGYVVATDFGSLEARGMVLLTVGGALASLGGTWRLLAGRLHRWRLEIGPDSITYRGYRTNVTYRWAQVHGARYQAKGPAGVAIDVKGAGKDPVVPITAFNVPAAQLIDEIQRAKAASRA